MPVRMLVAATTVLVVWMGAPGASTARGPLLEVADLDTVIAGLPASEPVDPLVDLVGRLTVLRAAKSHTAERTGLSQAVTLIRIVRTTRLVPAPPGPASPRLAIAFTRSNDRRGSPAGTARRDLRDRPTR